MCAFLYRPLKTAIPLTTNSGRLSRQGPAGYFFHNRSYLGKNGTAGFLHIRDHLRWAIGVGRRRHNLKDSTLVSYAAKADLKLSRLMHAPVAHPAGRALLKQIKAWRTKFFVFLTNRDVPATNNISEREIRPSVVFRKVTNGFRSDWDAQIHAGYRSVTGTARLSGKYALAAMRDLVDGKFAVADQVTVRHPREQLRWLSLLPHDQFRQRRNDVPAGTMLAVIPWPPLGQDRKMNLGTHDV